MEAIEESSYLERVAAAVGRRYQNYSDRSVPWIKCRWVAFVTGFCLLAYRILTLQGFYIVAYAYGIYMLNLFIGFLSPAIDPENDEMMLPQATNEEFRPFERRLPEFQFWVSAMRMTVISLLMTFFKMFDLPVFWPILLMYFILLFFLTMKQQIMHMLKHRYVPFSFGKQTYGKISKIDPNEVGNSSTEMKKTAII